MDTTDGEVDRREMIRRNRYEECRQNEIDEGRAYIRRMMQDAMQNGIGDFGLTWHEAMDCMGAWWDSEFKSRHSSPKGKP